MSLSICSHVSSPCCFSAFPYVLPSVMPVNHDSCLVFYFRRILRRAAASECLVWVCTRRSVTCVKCLNSTALSARFKLSTITRPVDHEGLRSSTWRTVMMRWRCVVKELTVSFCFTTTVPLFIWFLFCACMKVVEKLWLFQVAALYHSANHFGCQSFCFFSYQRQILFLRSGWCFMSNYRRHLSNVCIWQKSDLVNNPLLVLITLWHALWNFQFFPVCVVEYVTVIFPWAVCIVWFSY